MSDYPADEIDWCRAQWELLADGGLWIVPRSGLAFRKREADRVLTLVERLALYPSIREQQDGDIEAITARFAELDIAVVKAEGV